MKIENQVCTLEQATKLKELGITQKSIFYHHPNFNRPVFGEEWTTVAGKQYKKTHVCNDKKGSFSAFTVAELGKLLGEFLNYETFIDDTYSASVNKAQIPHPSIKEGNNWFCIKSDKSEAEVRAEMLTNLLVHKLLEVEACNKRLLS